MSDLIIGKGTLVGKGVYVNRDFRKGEIVTRYNLKPLTKEEYKKRQGVKRCFVIHIGVRYIFI